MDKSRNVTDVKLKNKPRQKLRTLEMADYTRRPVKNYVRGGGTAHRPRGGGFIGEAEPDTELRNRFYNVRTMEIRRLLEL